MPHRIHIVCFDVGGVIVQHCRTWQEGCHAAGLPLRAGADDPILSARRKELASLLTTGRITEHEFYARVAATTAGLYTPAEVERIHHAWLGPEYPDVGPVIDRLTAAGKARTGVLSNTNAPHWSRLEPVNGRAPQYPTTSKLALRLASHLIGHMKPAAESFIAFEEAAGHRGAEILFLDDLPENLAVARSRGWTCHHIDHTRPTAPQIEAALTQFDLL